MELKMSIGRSLRKPVLLGGGVLFAVLAYLGDQPYAGQQTNQLQQATNVKGYDPGRIGGLLPPLTRAAPGAIPASQNSADRAEDVEDEAERARKAAGVMEEILAIPDKGIPDRLVEKAHAIAVIPHTLRGAFVVGGRYGKGLIAHRNEDGSWSPPAYVRLTGAGIGFQIGASATDFVLVFTGREGLKPLLKGKIKLGADASVAAGPVGRTAAAATDVTLDSEIYSYSRSKGLFAGISLEGAALTMDDSANEKVYGRAVTAQEVLLEGGVSMNATVQPFIGALKGHVPPNR